MTQAASPWDSLLTQRRQPASRPADICARPGSKLFGVLTALAKADMTTSELCTECDLTSRQVWGLLNKPKLHHYGDWLKVANVPGTG